MSRKKFHRKSKHGNNQDSGFAIPVVFLILLTLYLYMNDKTLSNEDITIVCGTGALIVVVYLLLQSHKRRKMLSWDISKIDMMSGYEFENICKLHFEEYGYKVSTTPKSGDFGADLVLRNGAEKTVVQLKRYKSRVGVSAVQEIVAAKAYYGATIAMVVTNSFFTNAAVKLAEANDVILWDRNMLKKEFGIRG